jgi:hypothetical protein
LTCRLGNIPLNNNECNKDIVIIQAVEINGFNKDLINWKID